MNRKAPRATIPGMTTLAPARPTWRVPAALLALTAAPVIAGAFRVTQLTTGAP
jgi:hypothetical protein